MNALKAAIEKEIAGIEKNIIGNSKMLSEYGMAYWDGNRDALKWVLKKIEETSQ